jgi:transposase
MYIVEEEIYPSNVGVRRYLAWDNLNVHMTTNVLASLAHAGHTALPCAPHNPQDAPIEYFFGRLEEYLKQHTFEVTPQNFVTNVRATIDR